MLATVVEVHSDSPDDMVTGFDVDVEVEGDICWSSIDTDIDCPWAISLATIGIWLESICPILGWALCNGNCWTFLKYYI